MTKCDHCKREFHNGAVKYCPHPRVQQECGTNICYLCCTKCKNHTEDGVGIGCRLYEQKPKPDPKAKRKKKTPVQPEAGGDTLWSYAHTKPNF